MGATRMLDTGYHKKRRAEQLKDPEYRAEYEKARAAIAQVDGIMRQLDSLRKEAGMTKAELARSIGKEPATIRRLFTAEVNPELKTVAALATALDAKIAVVGPGTGSSPGTVRRSRQRRRQVQVA